MPRDLFGDVTRPSISIGSKKWYTLPVSLISHSAIVLALIAIPILAPAVMPSVFADADMTLIKIELPKIPEIPKPQPIRHSDVPPPTGPVAPIDAPTGVHPEKPPIDVDWQNRTGHVDGPFNVVDTITPPPPPEEKPPQAVRPGFQGVRSPVKTHHVDPAYPSIAQQVRLQGIVIIEATIGIDGQVTNARILRSIPLLDQAALDAVRQWRYTPTTLNGAPVPVIMTVTVNFMLK